MKALLDLRSGRPCVGQPNPYRLGQVVPECVVGFLFLFLYVAKIPLSFCRLFCLFTMNANVPQIGVVADLRSEKLSTETKQRYENNF